MGWKIEGCYKAWSGFLLQVSDWELMKDAQGFLCCKEAQEFD